MSVGVSGTDVLEAMAERTVEGGDGAAAAGGDDDDD